MKTITPAMDAHIDSEVTTLCTCWRIQRRDGVILGFTNHDQDLTIDGLLYDSAYGYTASAMNTNSDMSVDNQEVTGILDSEQIDHDDLRNGLFNFAEIHIFAVNWADLTQGKIALRRGWFGEATVGQNGMFHLEIRGLMQALNHVYVETYTPECRADFCDARCKLVEADLSFAGTVRTAYGQGKFTAGAIPPGVVGSTSVGAHRTWRLMIDASLNQYHTGFAEIKFYDQTGAEITGGGILTSSFDRSNHKGSAARDNDPNTNWSTPIGTPQVGQFFQISWDDPKDIKEFSITSTIAYDQSPTSFRMQYTDDDPHQPAKTFTDAKTCSHTWTAGGETALWAFGSANSDPINITTGSSTGPQPYEGASGYIGGTIRWTNGRNAGKTVEIIDFDQTTYTVTLFDNMAFPILPGDTFIITQGCDKSFATCKLYKNALNFRGEPDVPGQDEFLQYPNANA